MANRQSTVAQPNDWEDIGDWEDIPPPSNTPIPQVTTPAPEQSSMLSDVWHGISDPLWEGPSRFGKAVGDYIDQPSMATSPTGQGGLHDYLAGVNARMKGFGAGASEGIGDLVSSFTSPMSLATFGLGGAESAAAKTGFPRVAQLANIGSKIASAPMIAHGAGNTLSPDSTLAERAGGLTEMAAGAGGMFHTPVKGLSKVADSVKTNEPPITAESFGPDFFKKQAVTAEKGMPPVVKKVVPEGQPIDPVSAVKQASTPGEPTVPVTDKPYIDKFEKLRQVPVGTKYTVKPETMSRKKMVEAIKLGFSYEGLSDDGKIVMRKTKPSPDVKIPETPEMQGNVIAELANIPRTLMASWDMSAPLRQGLGLIHKPQFWKALPEMFKAWGSEEAYQAAQKAILDDPIFKKRVTADGIVKPSFAEDVGLKLTDLNSMTTREESIMSSMVDKIPGVRRSNRAYTIFLNKLRADTFKQMINDFGVSSGTNMKKNVALSKDIASFINTATGRGSLGPLEGSAKNLSSVLFSPRLMASRLGMMAKGAQAVFSPEVYMLKSPSVRREYLKSLAAIAGTASTFSQLLRLGGATVESDPASSDFGKAKIGNTRIDPYGGFQQYIVAAQRLMPHLDLTSAGLGEIGGKMKSTTTGQQYDLGNPGYGESTRADVLGRFIRSKTNPIINFGWGLMAGQKELSGKPMNMTTANPMENAIAQRFLPMLTQDIHDMIKDNETPASAKALATFLSTFGMGSQTYGPND
jgi:hypothetical protein